MTNLSRFYSVAPSNARTLVQKVDIKPDLINDCVFMI